MHLEKRRPLRVAVGPTVLAVFVHAGSLKSNPYLVWVPGDLTVILGIALIALIGAELSRTQFLSRSIWVSATVAVGMLLGVAAIRTPYGFEKALSFFTITLLALVGAVVLLREASQRRAFLGALAGIGAIVAILVALFPARTAEWSEVVTLAGTNTISTSQMVTGGAVVFGMYAIVGKGSTLRRIVAALAATGMFLIALSTGSRGPVVALGIGIAVALLFAPVFNKRRGRSIVAVLIALGIGAFFALRQGSEGLDRVLGFLAGDADTSTNARTTLWSTAWDHIGQMPFGGGWGYFGSVREIGFNALNGGTTYPHSVPLEIALEAGWATGLLFAFLAICGVVRLMRRANDPTTTMFLVLLIFTLTNSMLSGDINDNRLMWVMLTAAWVVPKRAVGTPATHHVEGLVRSGRWA